MPVGYWVFMDISVPVTRLTPNLTWEIVDET